MATAVFLEFAQIFKIIYSFCSFCGSEVVVRIAVKWCDCWRLLLESLMGFMIRVEKYWFVPVSCCERIM